MQNSVWLAMKRRCGCSELWTAAFAATMSAVPVSGTTISDVAHFTSRAHTLVTFEQRGNGIPTPTANATPLPADEYGLWGFTFAPGLSPGVAWVNDPSAGADAAQAVGGSLHLGIAAMDNQGDFFIHFAPRPITAFGFWVLHTRERSGIPTFDAIGASGILESAFFRGPAIDGRFGNIDYGFLGIALTSPIHSIHVRGDIAVLDNFRFIAVPEPVGVELIWLGGLPIGFLSLRTRRCAVTLMGRVKAGIALRA
jgi:hypothetical protein